jgi:hypothetical protein
MIYEYTIKIIDGHCQYGLVTYAPMIFKFISKSSR